MSKTNTIYPIISGYDSPIVSQPSSAGSAGRYLNHRAENGHGNGNKNDIKLPTPRRFLTPEDCPSGLECLVAPEYIFMKQSYHAFDGYPDDHAKYEVLNIFGQRMFMVVEKIEAAMNKIFCAGAIPFALRLYSKTSETHFRKEIMQIGGHPGSFGCGAEIVVDYDHKKLGRVEQESDCSTIRYTVQNSDGREVLKIIGPSVGQCCPMLGKLLIIHEFDIYLSDGETHVGRIAKHWSGVPNNKEVFTRSDIWGVKFPQEYDVRLKALLLASVFLMAYQFADK